MKNLVNAVFLLLLIQNQLSGEELRSMTSLDDEIYAAYPGLKQAVSKQDFGRILSQLKPNNSNDELLLSRAYSLYADKERKGDEEKIGPKYEYVPMKVVRLATTKFLAATERATMRPQMSLMTTVSAGYTVRCTRTWGKDEPPEVYYCKASQECCYGGSCCDIQNIFTDYWFIWVMAMLLIALIGACLMMRYSKQQYVPDPRRDPEIVTRRVRSPFSRFRKNLGHPTNVRVGESIPLSTPQSRTNNNNSSMGAPLTLIPVSVHQYDTYSETSDPPSRIHHQSGDSRSRSRNQSGDINSRAHQSGRFSPVSPAPVPESAGGMYDDAPPTYFEAVYEGVGRPTGNYGSGVVD